MTIIVYLICLFCLLVISVGTKSRTKYIQEQVRRRANSMGAFCAAERTPVRLPADTRRRQRTAL